MYECAPVVRSLRVNEQLPAVSAQPPIVEVPSETVAVPVGVVPSKAATEIVNVVVAPYVELDGVTESVVRVPDTIVWVIGVESLRAKLPLAG